MSDDNTCPLCRRYCAYTGNDVAGFVHVYQCRTCGDFKSTSYSANRLFPSLDAVDRAKLSAYTRERTLRRAERGHEEERWPILFYRNESVPYRGSDLVATDDAMSCFPNSVSERLDRTLLNLARLSRNPGTEVNLKPEDDYPLAYSEDEWAFRFILGQLGLAGDVFVIGSKFNDNETDTRYALVQGAQITATGWNRVAALQRGRIGEKALQAFVAMWFGPNVAQAYEYGIAPAVVDAGYVPLRIDRKQHNNRIDDEIIAEIRKSKFLVADFTGHRRGVYFEAGIALGLNMEVFWTCRANHISRSHFDTRQFNHVVWSTPEELRTLLARRIVAVVGPGQQPDLAQ